MYAEAIHVLNFANTKSGKKNMPRDKNTLKSYKKTTIYDSMYQGIIKRQLNV